MEEAFKFWKLKEKDGVKYLSFEDWRGVRVLYSTRIGGVSPPPYETLNLHYGRGDSVNNVQTNRERFFKIVSVNEERVVYTKQIHSNIVNTVKGTSDRLIGDGLLTERKGLFLGVFTADCLALFFYCAHKEIIGLLHAGRKGIERGIAKKGVDKICGAFRLEAKNLEVLFGPSIGPCCYEIGDDLIMSSNRKYITKRGGSAYLDMWKMVKEQLEDSGVEKIHVPEICSCDMNELFFSFRKSGERVGENLGIIGMETKDEKGLLLKPEVD